MSDLGEIKSYLGICITQNRSHKHIEIDQSGYIKDVLDCFGIMDTNPYTVIHPFQLMQMCTLSKILNRPPLQR